jgi:hypothetical protein
VLQAWTASGWDPLLTSGPIAVTEPSLERIIEDLQFCIVDARALQLKMLERILSIALLEAYESRGKYGGKYETRGR